MPPTALKELLDGVAISPYEEALAFEYLYAQPRSSLKGIVEQTTACERLPSTAAIALCGAFEPDGMGKVRALLDGKLGSFSVAISGTPSWPKKLDDSEHPIPLFYYRGDIGLLESKNVAVVGTRKATEKGLARARLLARQLVDAGITVTTGLARGIDTMATETALAQDGRVIGVIGTPIDECYPKENQALQDEVGHSQLLISQVPFYKYAHQPFKTKRQYFPERNELMAAVSDATVIVEASDTSGTLIQARACLHQGRPLFIMRSCVENADVTWPMRFVDKEGVYVLDDARQVIDAIGADHG